MIMTTEPVRMMEDAKNTAAYYIPVMSLLFAQRYEFARDAWHAP